MDKFSSSEEAFSRSLYRARALCGLHAYLSGNISKALDTSDILRAAVVLCVSAFDFLIHEIFRIEVSIRYQNQVSIDRLRIPFDVVVSSRPTEELIDEHIVEMNSYRSFVDPGKYAEAMSYFVSHPWSRVATKLGKSERSLKQRLRMIHQWRNRIVHEADIKPVLAGVELWPINHQDVLDAVRDIECLGEASIAMLRAR